MNEDGRLTLVCVTSGALVGLRSVIPLIETLIAASDGNTVVVGQVPSIYQLNTLNFRWNNSRLLSGTRVGSPNLGRCIVALGYTSIKSVVGTSDYYRARSVVDVPLGS